MSKCGKTIHLPQEGLASLNCQVVRECKIDGFKVATCSYLIIKIFLPVVQRKNIKLDVEADKDQNCYELFWT